MTGEVKEEDPPPNDPEDPEPDDEEEEEEEDKEADDDAVVDDGEYLRELFRTNGTLRNSTFIGVLLTITSVISWVMWVMGGAGGGYDFFFVLATVETSVAGLAFLVALWSVTGPLAEDADLELSNERGRRWVWTLNLLFVGVVGFVGLVVDLMAGCDLICAIVSVVFAIFATIPVGIILALRLQFVDRSDLAKIVALVPMGIPLIGFGGCLGIGIVLLLVDVVV